MTIEVIDALTESQSRLQRMIVEKRKIDERTEEIAHFLSKFFELGLLVKGNPALLESPEVSHFLNSSAENLGKAISEIRDYIRLTEDMFYFEWELDEWEQICERRSAVEFLFELYRDTKFEGWFQFFDIEDLDELIHDRGEREGGVPEDSIPQGIPLTHWWWWYPGDPATG